MGRNCHGPKLTWADFVMGRNDPEPSSAVISNGHFIAEQILRYLSEVYCTDRTKMGTKRVFLFQQKLSYLFLQDIRAVTLISFSA